jgi:hypothetical protein
MFGVGLLVGAAILFNYNSELTGMRGDSGSVSYMMRNALARALFCAGVAAVLHGIYARLGAQTSRGLFEFRMRMFSCPTDLLFSFSAALALPEVFLVPQIYGPTTALWLDEGLGVRGYYFVEFVAFATCVAVGICIFRRRRAVLNDVSTNPGRPCRQCGYPLTLAGGTRCPECGAPIVGVTQGSRC